MNRREIISEIDAEISRLQQAKTLLTGFGTPESRGPILSVPASQHGVGKTKYKMSAEARAKIAAAQKARWAKIWKAGKKTTSAKIAKKPASANKAAAKTGASKKKAPVALIAPTAPATGVLPKLG